jgi:3-isopropylmalate/(R)-2-methylmalate dehydratase small subunit
VEDGADIDINLSEGWIKTENETLPCTKLPPYMQNILDHGGLINFLNEGEE